MLDSNSNVIDVSLLPPPALVEALSFEEIYEAMRLDFLSRWSDRRSVDPTLPEIDILNLETDPLAVALQVCAYRELLIRARINDAACSNLLAFAAGADLDQLAANFNMTRLVVTPAVGDTQAVMETDDRFRRRLLVGIDAYSTAGPAGAYVYHALSAVPSLRDATAVSLSAGRVTVTIMNSAAAPLPTQEQLTTVTLALTDDSVRPMTDMVSVLPPNVVETSIVASISLYPGPDGSVVVANAIAKLNQFIEQNAYLGRDLRRSAIFSHLHVDGVLSVELTSPEADIVVGPREIVKITETTITIAGTGT
jgi:phage-related baseplate assembly protein